MSISISQLHAITATERVCSTVSLLGATFIIMTFLCDSAFHKPINRLVFFAAWGNILSNVATLISTSGVSVGGPVCQIQAFLIQCFLPADALWTFAMALNVYRTFFHKMDAQQMRAAEWKYWLFCYGVPFIPALVYCFVENERHGKVYGPATLWCWVSIGWDELRIATFYGPTWLVIIATIAIYLRVGFVIFKWRRRLLSVAQESTHHSLPVIRDTSTLSHITKTTEVQITREEMSTAPQTSHNDFLMTSNKHYDVEASCTLPPAKRPRHPSYNRPTPTLRQSRATADANKAAITYCKCAMLFFIGLLVTWVPSTINRVYTLVNPNATSFGLLYSSGLVLPLQGFWNGVIYVVTSFPACKALCERLVHRCSQARDTRERRIDGAVSYADMPRKYVWSESVEELTPVRSHGRPPV